MPEVPAPPLEAPRGTVQTRAYYAEADVSEWVLTNGAMVVFKPIPNGGMVSFSNPSPCNSGASPQQPVGSLSELFGVSYGPRALYVLAGDARPGEVEQAAARLLTLPESIRICGDGSYPPSAYRVAVEPDDDAALAVLVELLRARGGSAYSRLWNGQATLAGAPTDLATLRPTADDLGAARAAASRHIDAAAFWLEALGALYATDGALRPARAPAFVARFPARVARVSARDVTDLAARFAASPVR